jgi:hypothetical protein
MLMLGCADEAPISELPTDGEFTALSYNVHGLPSEITGDDTPGRMALIAPRLADFDIVGLQEDFDADNHAILEAGTEHPTKIRFDERVSEDRIYGPGLALFAQQSAVNTHHEHYTACNGVFDGSSDCLASKGFQAIRLVFGPEAEHTIDLYNSHLEAGSSAEDNAARGVHVDQLLHAMSTVSADRAVLFLADTNLHGDDPQDLPEITRLLADAGLTELCVAVDCPEPGRIDRLLYRSSTAITLEGRDWWIVEDFVDAANSPLSDHDPIAGRFGWVAH